MTDKKDFKVSLTPLAKGFSAKVGGTKALEERVRGELADLCSQNNIKATDIFLHTIDMKDTNGDSCIFIVKPSSLETDTMVIDTASYEESPALSSGPFKGKKIGMPVGDSE